MTTPKLKLPEDLSNQDIPIKVRILAMGYFNEQLAKESDREWLNSPWVQRKSKKLMNLHKELLIAKKQVEGQIRDVEGKYKRLCN